MIQTHEESSTKLVQEVFGNVRPAALEELKDSITTRGNNGDDDDNDVELCGIIHNIRIMSKFSFISLRVCGGTVQCVYDNNLELELKNESSVCIRGKIKTDSRSQAGFELHVTGIEILSVPTEEAPVTINKKDFTASLETDLTYRPVSLRAYRNIEIFRLQQGIVEGFREFLHTNKFIEIFTPKIVSGGAEGGANIFKMDYFGKKAFLAQSPQFYKQLMIPVFQRVFEIGPVFRAEKHDTARHLNEYVSVDFEMGFINSFFDIMDMETAMLQYCFRFLEERYSHTLKALGLTLPKIERIPTIKFKDAKELVASKYNRKIKDPYDLEPEEEKLISELFQEEYNSEFVFVTHYPNKKRPFYAMDDPTDPKYTLSFDLLFRGMEITTGGQRIHNYSEQIQKMQAKELDPADFEDYLQLHKYGCPPHGGLGMGLERFCMKLLGEQNIRKTSLFPRDTLRLVP